MACFVVQDVCASVSMNKIQLFYSFFIILLVCFLELISGYVYVQFTAYNLSMQPSNKSH